MAALTITHPFVSLIADSGNTSLVQPSNWNADHTVVGDATATTGYVLVGQGTGNAPIWSSSFPSIITFPDGTVGAPGIAFTNQTTTGFYRIGSGNVGLSLAGTLRYDFAASSFGLTSGTAINWASGDVTLTHAADTLTLSGDTLGSLVFAFAGTKGATGKTTASVTMAGGLGVSGIIYANQLYALSAQAGFCVVETTLQTTTGNWSIFNFRAQRDTSGSPYTLNMYVGIGDQAGGNLFSGGDPDAMVIGMTSGYPLNIASNNTVRIKMNTTGDLALLSTTASVSTITGALKVAGGAGIAAAVFIGTNLSVGAVSFGTSANNVIAMINGTAPTTSPANTGQLYVLAGALTYRGSGGTVTTIAPA